jgi:hypothetical protein
MIVIPSGTVVLVRQPVGGEVLWHVGETRGEVRAEIGPEARPLEPAGGGRWAFSGEAWNVVLPAGPVDVLSREGVLVTVRPGVDRLAVDSGQPLGVEGSETGVDQPVPKRAWVGPVVVVAVVVVALFVIAR